MTLEGLPTILIGNKTDLETQRAVTTAEGEEFARQQGWHYFETSAKNKTNINEVFSEILKEIKSRKAPQRKKKPLK